MYANFYLFIRSHQFTSNNLLGTSSFVDISKYPSLKPFLLVIHANSIKPVFTKHNHTSTSLTAAWLLPIVPPITVAATGSSLASLLIDNNRLDYALTIMITSYIMNGVGLLLACGLMVIYFQRLALHHLPGR